jgi:cellobiose PTS system EIIB component
MIKILLCCGGGFSSSALATKVQKDIVEQNLQNEYYIEFSPFGLAKEKMQDFDIVVCCPHLRFEVKRLMETVHPDKPFYILPPRMYGLLDIRDLSLDAVDAIELFNRTKINPVHFPGEENTIRIIRNVAYRNWKNAK